MFGVDSAGFFIDTEAAGEPELVVHDLHVQGEADVGGTLGFLNVRLSDFELDTSADTEITLDLLDPGSDPFTGTDDNKLRLYELEDVQSLFDAQATGNPATDDLTLHATFEATPSFFGLPLAVASADITVAWADISDPFTVRLEGLGALADLNEQLRGLLRQGLQQLDNVGQSLAGIEFLNTDIPVLNKSVNELFGIEAVLTIGDAIADYLDDPDPNTPGVELPSLSGLVDALVAALEQNLATAGGEVSDGPLSASVGYDPDTNQLQFAISLQAQEEFTTPIELGFDLAEGLADLEFSSDATVGAGFDMSLAFAIDVGALIGGADVLDSFFITEAQASGSLLAEATNIDAVARFGFLGIEIQDGEASATASFSFGLNDPGTTPDGRITLRELGDGLSDLGTFIEVDLNGALELSLPIAAPFLGITTATASTTLVVSIPDITDFTSINVTLPSGLLDLSNFTNMDAGTLVSLLGTISNWLEDLRHSFNAADVPFIGPALDEALKFSDLFHDTLLFDDLDDEDNATGTNKLLDATNRPTFDTVQEMIARLVDILGAGDYVHYNKAQETLTFDLVIGDINSTTNFGVLDLPIQFDLLQALAPIAELSSNSHIQLSAGGGLTLTIGVYLGNAGGVELDNDTSLASLKDGITFSQALVIAAASEVATTYGRLSADGKFKLSINGGAEKDIIIHSADTEDNTTVDHLVADINAALVAAGVGAQVSAVRATGPTGSLNKINLEAAGGVTTLTLSAQNGDPAVTQIGLRSNMTAQPDAADGGQLKIKGEGDVGGLVGRPSGDAVLQVSLNGAAAVPVTISTAATSTNRNILDVVVDVQNALDAAGFENKIQATSLGKRLIFKTLEVGATALSITVAGGDPAITGLGLQTSNTGNSYDLVITTTDNVQHGVAFGADVDTLGEVLSAITTQTGGIVTGSFSDGATRIKLTDTLHQTAAIFKVENAFGSRAAFDLAIFGEDTVDPVGDPRSFDLEGGQLGGVSPLDRLFIKNVQAAAKVAIVTPQRNAAGAIFDTDGDGSTTDGLEAEARFGFVGIHGSGGISSLDGTGPLTVGVDVKLKPADATAFDPDARITLKDLLDNIANIGDFLVGPTIDGSGKLEVAVSITPSFSEIHTGSGPKLTIALTSLAEILDGDSDGDKGYTITTEGFEDLLNFDNIGFGDIIKALRALVDFLQQFQEFDFLNQPIPVINVSFNDLLTFAEDFESALDEVESNPAATVQVLESKLKEALGIPQGSDLLGLELVDGTILRIDLNFEPSFSESLPIDLALPIDSGVIDLSGQANLHAEGDLDLQLSVGIDLDNLTNFWVFEDTGIAGSLTAGANDISFTAALGGIGARIIDGEAQITGDFNFGLKAAAMTAGTGPNRRALLTDILGSFGDSVDLSLTGEVTGLLPVYFPTESLFRGNLEIGAALSANLDDGLIINGTLTGADVVADGFLRIPAEIFNIDFSQFSALDNLLLIIDGVDGFLGLLEDAFDGELAGFTLPLIGDQLADAADVIGDFRKGFIDGLRNAVETAAQPDQNYISLKLFELLHDQLHILADRNDDGLVTIADVQLQTNVDQVGVAPEDVFMQWNVKLGSTIVDAGAGLDFQLGIPGLGFETRGAINVEVAWDLDLGFGVGISRGGFYIDVSDTNELEVNLDVTLPGAGLTGKLAFLQLDADNNGNTHLGATLGVDIRNRTTPSDNLIGIAELGNIGIDVGIAAEAIVDLGLELKLNSDLVPGSGKVFPKIVGDFYLEWSIGNRAAGTLISFDAIGDAIGDGLKVVEFRDVGLDLGSFISDFLSPIVAEVKKFTEPFQPVIDVVTAPIPVISDLAGQPITLVDLAALTGYVDADLIYAIADLITLINSIPDPIAAGSLILPFGDFTVYNVSTGTTPHLWESNFDQADRDAITLPDIDADDIAAALDGLADGAPASSHETAEFTNGLAGHSFGDFISFPIFQNPSQIFGLLMGNDATLIQIDLPQFAFQFSYSQFFPIYGPLGVALGLTAGIVIDPPAFGYDTLGLRHFFDSGFRDPLSLFDGLFLSAEQTVLKLSASFSVSAELNVVFAKAGVGARITFETQFDLHDPNEDGKVRLYELANNFLNEARYGEPVLAPLAIFDVSGRLFLELFAYLKINLLLTTLDFDFPITPPITLLDFDIPFTRVPTLANELSDGVLRLNMGEFANQRLEGDDSDFGEQFFVSQVDADTVKVWAPNLGVTEDMAQEYDVTSKILALGGEGDDVIDLSGVTADLEFEIEGGTGNDQIKAGLAGRARINGGGGDDEIEGTDHDDIIFGGLGNDFIDAKGGNDLVFADDGKIEEDGLSIKASGFGGGADVVIGGAGNDVILGGGGNDKLGGDLDPRNPDPDTDPAGNDRIFGDGALITLNSANNFLDFGIADVSETSSSTGGADTIFGHRGDDIIFAGGGNDNVEGGAGADIIFGEDGFDTLAGNAGADQISGGLKDDTILGGDGDDQLSGDEGKDLIRGGLGTDTITGGAGVDTFYGEQGNDTISGDSDKDFIYGGGGDDIIHGGAGSNIIWGDDKDGDPDTGPDGNDTIDALNDPDEIHGQGGNDNISAADGNNVIFGDNGTATRNSTGMITGTFSSPGAGDGADMIVAARAITSSMAAAAQTISRSATATARSSATSASTTSPRATAITSSSAGPAMTSS